MAGTVTLGFWPLLGYTMAMMVLASAITWAAMHGYYATRRAAAEPESADDFLTRMGGGVVELPDGTRTYYTHTVQLTDQVDP